MQYRRNPKSRGLCTKVKGGQRRPTNRPLPRHQSYQELSVHSPHSLPLLNHSDIYTINPPTSCPRFRPRRTPLDCVHVLSEDPSRGHRNRRLTHDIPCPQSHANPSSFTPQALAPLLTLEGKLTALSRGRPSHHRHRRRQRLERELGDGVGGPRTGVGVLLGRRCVVFWSERLCLGRDGHVSWG